ncbi:MAG TPA: magnesium transporter CorA family protein [Rhizomicrobium sp.]
MMKTYLPHNGGLKAAPDAESAPAIAGGLWIDLIDPTPGERQTVNNALHVELPTHADMEEIEISSRLYSEDGGLFMTALILSNSGTEKPVADVVTFILVRDKLITLRYIDPQPFRTFTARCGRSMIGANKAETALMALIDVIIDRLADILERAGSEIEGISREIFDSTCGNRPITSHDFRKILRALGRKHDLSSKIRDSLLSLARMLAFLTQAMDTKPNKDVLPHLKTLTRDVQSLQDHSSYMGTKLSYLLDATLGLINIDQNNIIKTMSVAAMVFLPPTLFASIWGMNFHFMPELDEWWGYPLSVVVMVASAVLPYLWFKRKGWL